MADSNEWPGTAVTGASAPTEQSQWPGTPAPVSQAKAIASVTANDNPDQSAKVIQWSKKTSVPPAVIEADVPGFVADKNRQDATSAVDRNPKIASYIEKDPRNASVSADDWDALHKFSMAMSGVSDSRAEAHSQVVNSIPEIAELLSSAQGRQRLSDAINNIPMTAYGDIKEASEGLLKASAANLLTPPKRDYDTALGAVGGAFQNLWDTTAGVAEGAAWLTGGGLLAGLAKTFAARPIAMISGAPLTETESAVNLALLGLKPGAVPGGPRATNAAGEAQAGSAVDDFLHMMSGKQTRSEIDDFLREAAAKNGPTDQILMIEDANAKAAALDKAMQVAQESKTKTRAPEKFADFAAEHTSDTVYLPTDKVIKLYESKGVTPAEGDGLFGYVPDLAKRLEVAKEAGTELAIPVSQYIAHTDPTVHEGLKDDVRLTSDALTVEEAKELKKEIQAYHGTPHEVDRFDATKIGTGEGAQVYGHGLYFAEQKSVAEQYKNQLSPQISPYARGFLDKAGGDTAAALKDFDENASWKDPETRKEIETGQPTNPGKVYKVSIAADPEHFLDWDKPLSEQSQHVQDVARALKEKHDLPFVPDAHMDVVTGEQLLGHLKDVLADRSKKTVPDKNGFYRFDDGRQAASAELAKAGIPGIKYLDQGSRPNGKSIAELETKKKSLEEELATMHDFPDSIKNVKQQQIEMLKEEIDALSNQTRNYVVFDDKLIRILEKNDQPIVQETVTQAVKQEKDLFLSPLFKNAPSDLTKSEFARYSKKIENQEKELLEKAVAAAAREIKKRITPEWKANESSMLAEVTQEQNYDPTYLADRFWNAPGKGIVPNRNDPAGRKLPEHQIPKSMAEASADEWAPVFGFATGSDMSTAVVAREALRKELGLSIEQFKARSIKEITAKRMEETYGHLDENIAAEARGIALSDTHLDILSDELAILAKEAGGNPPFSKDELVAWIKDKFEGLPVAEAGQSKRFDKATYRNGREAEKALLKGDFAEAFQAKQRQMLSFVMAKEAAKLERVIARTERQVARVTNERVIDSMDQAHVEQARGMLASAGYPQKFPPSQPLVPLKDFVADSEGQLAIADWLQNGPFPGTEGMTTEQYRDFEKSLKSMLHNARKVKTLSNAQKTAELENVVMDVVASMERFPKIDQPMNPSLVQRIQGYGRYVTGAHLLVERMFDYTDRFDPHGPLTEFLDRPLRDANVKEIQLTEQVTKMLRGLAKHTDDSIHDLIPNRVIPDQMAVSGMMQMTRQNLRQLMLNMGNYSNIEKVVKGFQVKEGDVWKLIDANATKADWEWVQGVWDAFKHLKPEADAVQLRDTGVPVDSLPMKAVKNKHGDFEGGYYPIVYDKLRSNIEEHRNSSGDHLFDAGYHTATTPHRYTEARTDFAGALDLSGNFLASRIKGMVHDIAFREAVRNANRLITNDTFQKTVAQRWSKEYAELLPGWLKGIANSHNFDDAYAQGLVRGMSLVRQNVVSALIAFNPGTYIKHGLSAAALSSRQVGATPLLLAGKDIVAGSLPQEYLDAFADVNGTNARAESVRQFILESSAVMRRRQSDWDQSIAGAIESMNTAGFGKLVSDTRHGAMWLGRLPVAYSDSMSAMPTWYAAYKKAFAAGETHADAVFIADKEVSRAHGSSFVGDQPAVTRIGNTPAGELARWFVPLYKFWNHQVNNEFQLAWDMAAKLRGPEGGGPGSPPPPNTVDFYQAPDGSWHYGPEPGASAQKIAKNLAYTLGMIWIEEQGSAALDEHNEGFGLKMAKATIRFFGGGFVGLREMTNAIATGNEPSVGLISTFYKALSDEFKDIMKAADPHAAASKNWLIHAFTTMGMLTGVGGAQVGRTASFLKDLSTGRERPNTLAGYRQGIRTGHSQPRTR